MMRSGRGSAGEESDEEWVEEQLERAESTESLDELGLPLSSSKTSSSPRPSASYGNLNSANLIVLDFGPSFKGWHLLSSFCTNLRRKNLSVAHSPSQHPLSQQSCACGKMNNVMSSLSVAI